MPLSDQRFDESHEWFEGQSNQQAQILGWLRRFGKSQIERRADDLAANGETFRVLSVGCGSGILDLPLIKTLADQIESGRNQTDVKDPVIHYTGIDPNPVACGRFRDEFDNLGTESVELSVLEETVESYDHNQSMDLTHVVHSMYYFGDPAVSLRTLIQNVADDGELVIFQAPKGELNRLADCFWQGHVSDPIWFSADLEKHLQETGISFTRSCLEAEVDVTDCFDDSCPKGRLTFDFIVQSDCEQLSAPIRRSVLEHLRSISRIDGQKIYAPHPVDIFVIHQSDEAQIQSDARVACSP
ncbi:methyltransferase domain-containing protein [Rubripirellula obstinata]|nr:methyltransferase domain-containing protein [Rubripirellula obstinata]